MNDARAGKRLRAARHDAMRILVPVGINRMALGALCAASILVASTDGAVATILQRVGAAFGGRVVEQIDDRTFLVDIGGPAKQGALRGVVTVRADRATRFDLTAGVRAGRTLYGSLGDLHIGPTTPIEVTLGRLLPDGSYRLLTLTTMTR